MTRPAHFPPDADVDAMIATARDAGDHAWAPYSGYRVGAVLLGDDGNLYSGCNVENATYGATVCAERNAIAAAVRAGVTRFRALVVHVEAPEPAVPCGLCRQVLCEFVADLPILSVTSGSDARREATLAELLPHAFGRATLERAQQDLAAARARGEGDE